MSEGMTWLPGGDAPETASASDARTKADNAQTKAQLARIDPRRGTAEFGETIHWEGDRPAKARWYQDAFVADTSLHLTEAHGVPAGEYRVLSLSETQGERRSMTVSLARIDAPHAPVKPASFDEMAQRAADGDAAAARALPDAARGLFASAPHAPIASDPPAVAWVRDLKPMDRAAEEQAMLTEWDTLRAKYEAAQQCLRELATLDRFALLEDGTVLGDADGRFVSYAHVRGLLDDASAAGVLDA